MDWWLETFGVPWWVAALVGFAAGLIVGYAWVRERDYRFWRRHWRPAAPLGLTPPTELNDGGSMLR